MNKKIEMHHLILQHSIANELPTWVKKLFHIQKSLNVQHTPSLELKYNIQFYNIQL